MVGRKIFWQRCHLLHADLCRLLRVEGIGRYGAHAAGVQALIPIQGPLVIHGRYHGRQRMGITEGQHRNLRPGEEFLNDYPAPAFPENPILHNGADPRLSLGQILGNDNPLAQG